MKFHFNKVALLVATMVASSASQAVIVYENGTHAGIYSGNNPFSFNSRYVAMDFTLGSATFLDGLTFNAFTTQATLPVSNVDVKIYANNAGAVGSELFSGGFGVASQNYTGSLYGYNLIDFNVSLPDWNLAAGSYWIGLQADPAQWDMHWSIVNNIGYSGKIGDSFGTATSYSGYGFEHYFSLSGNDNANNDVPEPGSLALAGLALAGLGVTRRRKKETV